MIMDKQNDSITRLLEMLDNPEAYSEQEIQDIINSDDECREAYRLLVEAKRSYRDQSETPVDVDTAWQRFERERLDGKDEAQSMRPSSSFHTVFRKAAAIIISVILVGGIALAAIHVVGKLQRPRSAEEQSAQTSSATAPMGARLQSDSIVSDALTTEGDSLQVVTYDNIPLGDMLPEIASFYSDKTADEAIEVVFRNEETSKFRFHFVWDRKQTLNGVVDDLNHFERIHVTLKRHQLIVE
jgi:hypothetical protein